MAITVSGMGPTITAQKWSELFYRAAEGGAGEYVDGFKPTVATGTRKVTIAPGTAAVAGVLVESNSAITVELDNANNARWDAVVLELNWSAMTASITSVRGVGSDVSPALTKDAGNVWQIPLARVLMRAGVGQIDSDDLWDWRPTRRQSRVFRPKVPNVQGFVKVNLVLQEVPYPGFDYRLRMGAKVNFAWRESGYTELAISVNGENVASSRGPDNNAGPAVIPQVTTGRLTDAVNVRLNMWAHEAGGQGAQSYETYSSFEIVQEPF